MPTGSGDRWPEDYERGRPGWPPSRASGPPIFTMALSFREYTSLPSRVMCQPQENTSRAPGGA